MCGQYFCKGQNAKRLDRFLTFLHRYTLAKASLPLDIDLDLQVLLQLLSVSAAESSQVLCLLCPALLLCGSLSSTRL